MVENSLCQGLKDGVQQKAEHAQYFNMLVDAKKHVDTATKESQKATLKINTAQLKTKFKDNKIMHLTSRLSKLEICLVLAERRAKRLIKGGNDFISVTPSITRRKVKL